MNSGIELLERECEVDVIYRQITSHCRKASEQKQGYDDNPECHCDIFRSFLGYAPVGAFEARCCHIVAATSASRSASPRDYPILPRRRNNYAVCCGRVDEGRKDLRTRASQPGSR